MTEERPSLARRAARRYLPDPVRANLSRRYRRLFSPRPIARLGTPRRLLPVSRSFGIERGIPIDRYYIENFLRRHSGLSEYAPGAIHGDVLEVGDDMYTQQFGLGVDHVDVLDASPRRSDQSWRRP